MENSTPETPEKGRSTTCTATRVPENTKTTNFDIRLNRAKHVFWYFAQRRYPGYEVDANNKEAIIQCLVYFLGGNSQVYPALDPKKGLMLVGDVGCGKSLLIEILQDITRGVKGYGFRIFKAADIADEYALGSRGEAYGEQLQNGRYTTFRMCIDDLGFEPVKVLNYGNEIIPLAHILTKRSRLFDQYGQITHLTTNLNAEEIEKLYGDRIRDRLRKMCNVITLEGKSRRK
jgi:DNA replication protein DnaC